MFSLLVPTLVVLVAVRTGYSHFLHTFPSSRTGDHESCFSTCDLLSSESGNTAEFNEANTALDQNNATDAQVALLVSEICSQENKTYTCMEEAARNCTPGLVPFYAGYRKFYTSICDDPHWNGHFRNIRRCSSVQEFLFLWAESLHGGLMSSSEELYHNASHTAYAMCAAAEKFRERAQGSNITEQCGADTAASYTYFVDKTHAAFCLSGNADNGVSNVTFGTSLFFLLLAAFLVSKDQE